MNAAVLGQQPNNRTFVMPSPGGAAAPAAGLPPLPAEPALAEVRAGGTPLLAAANPLLNLVYQVRTLVHNAEPDRLKAHLVDEVRRFEATAKSLGVNTEHVLAARYCLCTVLDETASQTPWGGNGAWSRNSLLVTFHNETWGGEKFFQLLAKLAQAPAQHIDLLELMYFCICLGFEGRYRIISNGQVQLETLRRRLLEIIVSQRGQAPAPLSLHWQGESAPRARVWGMIPVWVSAATALTLGIGLYIALAILLGERSTPRFVEISQLELPAPPVAVREGPPPIAFKRFLQPEIEAGLVVVEDAADSATVRLLGDGLFASGSTEPRPQYRQIIERIAEAVAALEVRPRVRVEGHTDNVPMRSLRFASNYELSLARAEAVAQLLRPRLGGDYAIEVEGRGESAPLVREDSTEGRARNRRVEIIVYATPAQRVQEVR
jgi:type VI secretion system protein ImpK